MAGSAPGIDFDFDFEVDIEVEVARSRPSFPTPNQEIPH
jgi:hypothetical protein